MFSMDKRLVVKNFKVYHTYIAEGRLDEFYKIKHSVEFSTRSSILLNLARLSTGAFTTSRPFLSWESLRGLSDWTERDEITRPVCFPGLDLEWVG